MVGNGVPLRELIIATKDGDWGESAPNEGTVPYRVIRGADFPNARMGDLSEIPLRFLRSQTVDRRTLEPNDILIETAGGSHDRPTGRTLLITRRILDSLDSPATCASFCRFLRADPKKIDPRYLFWYLQNIYQEGGMWEHQVQHTGIARFQFTRFADNLRVQLPTLAEQEAVAQALCTLDDKIELNRRMNQTLEAMARAIFKLWFVDFDPVYEGHPAFPKSFESTPFGLLPRGWMNQALSEFCQIGIGGDWGEDQSFDEACEVVCLRGVDLENLRMSGSAAPPHRWISATSLKKRSLTPRDVLIATSGAGPVGRPLWISPAIAQQFEVPMVYSNFCKRLTTSSAEEALYLDRILYEIRDSGEVLDYVTGTSVPNLDLPGLLRSRRVCLPPSPVLKEFSEIMINIYERLYSLESRTLASLRDTLLPKLLSGEIRVKQAEKIVGEVV